jgi:Domain of unknown function (DUF4388)
MSPMPLQGTFDVINFSETLRLAARQQLTGRLHVRFRAYGAHLFLEEGQLVGVGSSEHRSPAMAGDVRSRLEEVCCEMLEVQGGGFEFHPGKPRVSPPAERYRVETVLGRARKRLQEWRGLQEFIPSLEMRVHLTANMAGRVVTLDQERWKLLTAVDGRRTLRAIGRILEFSDFDVCRLVKSLLDDGLVELDSAVTLTAAGREALPKVAAPSMTDLEQVPTDGDLDGETEPAEGEDPAASPRPRIRRLVRIPSKPDPEAGAGAEAT